MVWAGAILRLCWSFTTLLPVTTSNVATHGICSCMSDETSGSPHSTTPRHEQRLELATGTLWYRDTRRTFRVATCLGQRRCKEEYVKPCSKMLRKAKSFHISSLFLSCLSVIFLLSLMYLISDAPCFSVLYTVSCTIHT